MHLNEMNQLEFRLHFANISLVFRLKKLLCISIRASFCLNYLFSFVAILKKNRPNMNKTVSVATATLTEFVIETVIPTSVVPINAAPLPQIS